MNMPNPKHMPKHIPMPMYMPKDVKLARAYVPDQPYERLFPLNEALMKGTLFANLYQPYNRENQ